MICTVFKTQAGTAQTNASFSAPPAAVGAHEGPPELGAPDHVHEEVGRRVDAHEEVAEGDEGVDEAVGGAVALAAEEPLVDVGDELEALAAEEEEGDADQGGAKLAVLVGSHGHLKIEWWTILSFIIKNKRFDSTISDTSEIQFLYSLTNFSVISEPIC